MNLKYKSTGSGDTKLRGSSYFSDCSITGSGNFDAKKFITNETSINTRGSGDVSVYTSQKLTASTSKSGNISYYGNPEISTFIVNGSGDISGH